MADVINFVVPEKTVEAPAPRTYSVDIVQYPDNLAFTVNGIKVCPDSLYKIASELEKIAHIIRTDIVTGIVPETR